MYHNRLLIRKQPRLYFEPAGGSFVAGLLFSFSCINYLAASHLILIRWCHYYSTTLYCIIWSVGNKSYFTLLYFTICSTDGWLDGLYLLSVQQMDDWLVCICHHFETLGQFRYSTSSFYHNCFCTLHISLCIFVSNQTSSQSSSWYHRSSPNTTCQPAPRCLLFNRCPCVRIK